MESAGGGTVEYHQHEDDMFSSLLTFVPQTTASETAERHFRCCGKGPHIAASRRKCLHRLMVSEVSGYHGAACVVE